MNKKITAAIATSVLALAACGGGGSDAVAGFEAVAEAQEIELDSSCVKDLADELSDDDAEIIAGLADNPTPDDLDISEAGDAIGERIFDECVVGEDEG